MISFMILGAPRSGTTWASNWLTSERTLCLHDPMFTHQLEDLDKLPHDRPLGVADTGLALYPSWVNEHPARKVILHRDPEQIEDSLRRAGLPKTPRSIDWSLQLREIDGLHVEWTVLFNAPGIIHHWLFGDAFPFDETRHALLTKLNVQVDFEKVDPDPVACGAMVDRFNAAVRAMKEARK